MEKESSKAKEKFMAVALEYAEKAALLKEVPVGAFIVKDNKIISVGYNRRETDKNALVHAEIEAINNACKALGGCCNLLFIFQYRLF